MRKYKPEARASELICGQLSGVRGPLQLSYHAFRFHAFTLYDFCCTAALSCRERLNAATATSLTRAPSGITNIQGAGISFAFAERFMCVFRSALVLLAVLSCCQTSRACLWDRDTLAMERQKFPTTLELITGKFLRHSPQFYQWRVDDRQKKLAGEPGRVEYYDDLAVAYDKLGKPELAIEAMLKKDAIKAGLYETHANLATFYIHAGDLTRGLEGVNRALEINPDAHFGREKYQKYLVEYLISRQVDGKTVLPLGEHESGNFLGFLKTAEPNLDTESAVKGVLGMLRFARYDSPILLEVLGDLLQAGPRTDSARQLAARAYLRASQFAPHEVVKEKYHELAGRALSMQLNLDGKLSVAEVEHELYLEVNQANQWFAGVQQDELGWIAAGENPEDNFAEKYYADPEVDAAVFAVGDRVQLSSTFVRAAFWTLLAVAVALAGLMLYRYRRRQAATVL